LFRQGETGEDSQFHQQVQEPPDVVQHAREHVMEDLILLEILEVEGSCGCVYC